MKRSRKRLPSWQGLIGGHKRFRVNFDMKIDLTGAAGNTIPRNMSRLMLYSDGKWQTEEEDGTFHLYNAFRNGQSRDPKNRKISVLGLVLSYNQNTGGLDLLADDVKDSKTFYPKIPHFLVGRTLAQIVPEKSNASKHVIKRQGQPSGARNQPCNVVFSNALLFDPTDTNGKCLHFTASTEGSIYLVFSTLPRDHSSWYYTEITPQRVAIYKVTPAKKKGKQTRPRLTL